MLFGNSNIYILTHTSLSLSLLSLMKGIPNIPVSFPFSWAPHVLRTKEPPTHRGMSHTIMPQEVKASKAFLFFFYLGVLHRIPQILCKPATDNTLDHKRVTRAPVSHHEAVISKVQKDDSSPTFMYWDLYERNTFPILLQYISCV